ncbi:T9SS type A sorting domain-containing protein [Litoribaculum gwangyangense]|uniref:Secretion system C-terminal sorting domain-containing protein n=1 Tax=Litoribaculum gwangyangense TaxID=1130722 RepID=A0ABP9CVY2_9FLAO
MIQKITFLFFTVFSLVLSAQTVNIEGDPYAGNPYATITDAIAASTNAADVILITGIHTEPITIDKSITIRGTDPLTDIIQAAASAVSNGAGSRAISISEGAFTINIENLGVRYGNDPENGGGVNIDKVTGFVTLNNVIIEENYTAKNGGGIGVAGSNANIVKCIIRNNSSALDGGGMIAAPNNGSGINSTVNLTQSLIFNNLGRNGGGIYINGNNNFGNDYLIDVNIENSTISTNSAFSASGGNGGGAIFSASFPWTSNTSVGNVTLKLVHATVYNNTHAALNKSGLQFGSGAATNLSAFNSIIVSFGDDVATKALNFANSNTTDVVNCILGGLNAPPLAIIDDVAKNNQKGRTANQSGLTGALTDEGGNTLVMAITDGSAADDYCTAATGETIPTIDQRGFNREGINDAGAFEFAGTLSTSNSISGGLDVRIFPNPANDLVKISGVLNIDLVRVYSILGTLEKVVYSQKEIDVSDLSSGLHMMEIQSEGQKTVKRIIIK